MKRSLPLLHFFLLLALLSIRAFAQVVVSEIHYHPVEEPTPGTRDRQTATDKIDATSGLALPWAATAALTVARKLYRISTSPNLTNWTPLTPLVFVSTTGTQSTTLDTGGAPELFVHVEIAP